MGNKQAFCLVQVARLMSLLDSTARREKERDRFSLLALEEYQMIGDLLDHPPE